MNTYPTYSDYLGQVNHLIDSNELTVEQGVILLSCYKGTLERTPVHINYLMNASGLGWKQVNYTLNGLVLRGAIKRMDEKYYMV